MRYAMNILMLGSDDTMLVETPSKKNEYVRYRHIEYAKKIDSLHIVLKTVKKGDLKVRKHSNELVCYPTLSSNRIIGLFDLYCMGAKIIKENHINLIVTADPFGPGLVGYLLKKRFNLPLCVQMFGDYVFNKKWIGEKPKHKLVSMIGKFLFKRADCIRVHGMRVKETIIKKLKVDENKIHVLPIPIRKNIFLKPSKKTNDIRHRYVTSGFNKIVLWVGRLVPQKDIKTLLMAATLVLKKNPHTLFCLLGEGPERQELEGECQRLKIKDNLLFMGQIPQVEIPNYYHAADVFVLSSAYEDTARALVEAACSSKPIVTTDTTGARDIVVNDKNGFVVNIGDYRQLSEKIIILLDNPDMAEKFGLAGKEIVSDMFDDQKIVNGIVSMWKNIICHENHKGVAC